MFYKCQAFEDSSIGQIVTCVVLNVRPIVDVFGMIGNILCICINCSPRLRRAPTTIHLTALAVYDLLFLLGRIPTTFSGTGAQSLIYSKSGCRTFMIAICVTSTLSVWTVTAFTIERFIVVYFPLHRAAVCTLKNQIIIQLSLIPIPLLFYGIYVFLFFPNDWGMCEANDEHHILYIWLNLIDSVVANLIPLIAIFTLNGLTAFRMWKNSQERKDDYELRLHRHSSLSRKSSSAVSRPLIIVSTTFAVLNLPYFAIRLRSHYVEAFGSMEEDWTEFDHIFELIALLLFNLNFAVDFLLYNISSATFRKVAMDILLPKKLRRSGHTQLSRLPSSLYSRRFSLPRRSTTYF